MGLHFIEGATLMIDEKKVQEGIRMILEGIGEDLNRPGLIETPQRIANMYKEIYGGLEEDAAVHLSKTFPAINNELVLEKDITFYSTCEHHLLPFYGKAHIAYIPNENGLVIGLSKLARIVNSYARRPQLQERLTAQIADFIEKEMQPQGVAVVVEAEHLCMTMRGIRAAGSKTQTSALRGTMKKDARTRAEVMTLLGIG